MIPVATTSITVLRPPAVDLYAEPYSGTGTATMQQIATGVPAVIERPRGTIQLAGGEQTITELRLLCDPVDLQRLDRVTDESTGTVYRILWLLVYPGDHIEAGLRDVEGET